MSHSFDHIIGRDKITGIGVYLFGKAAFFCKKHHFVIRKLLTEISSYALKQPHAHDVFKKTVAIFRTAFVGEIGIEGGCR